MSDVGRVPRDKRSIIPRQGAIEISMSTLFAASVAFAVTACALPVVFSLFGWRRT
jgi:hypothetical protein